MRGAGKSETARALFGLDKIISGSIEIENKPVSITSPRKAMRYGIAMVPEERLTEGLFMKLSVKDNIASSNYRGISHAGIANKKKTRDRVEKLVNELDVRIHSIEQQARTLSGGNQQKVVIGKCLNASPRLLILDEPTRGVDVGAKEEIYSIIRKLARENVSILVCSSEYDEIAALCDRVVLIAGGRIITTLSNAELDSQRVRMLTMNKGVMT